MRIIPLTNTNLNASVICLGTGNLGGSADRKLSFELLDTYVAHGGNFLDTAKVYSDWRPGEKSVSEKTIGLWLKDRKNRDSMIIATKGAHPELASMHFPRLSKEEIVHDIDASLQNLQVDCIDLYWLHRDDRNRPVSDIIDSLSSQVVLGKIKYFGCSNWQLDRIQAAQLYATQKGIPGFVANQPCWCLAEVNLNSLSDKTMVVMDHPTKEFHQKTKMAVVPYSSQANGWFQKKAENRASDNLKKTYDNPNSEERYNRVIRLAAETKLSISQIVLGYLTSQSFAVFPIIGARNIEMLTDSLHAGDIKLSQAQVQYLENI